MQAVCSSVCDPVFDLQRNQLRVYKIIKFMTCLKSATDFGLALLKNATNITLYTHNTFQSGNGAYVRWALQRRHVGRRLVGVAHPQTFQAQNTDYSPKTLKPMRTGRHHFLQSKTMPFTIENRKLVAWYCIKKLMKRSSSTRSDIYLFKTGIKIQYFDRDMISLVF